MFLLCLSQKGGGAGHLGGSEVELLPLALGVDPGVLGSSPALGSPRGAGLSFSAYVSASLRVSLLNR